MGMVVNHNISAINTLRNLNQSNKALSSSLQKLSSGYRINTGKDGPADLIISEQLRAQVAGLQKAVSNTQEAMNVIGIAEGALNEMNEILRTMRQLALHAANSGITSPSQVAADQAEVDSSIQTIERIANTTKYSDQFLLNGAQSILYDRTLQKGNALIDTTYTRIDQVFKRSGVTENFTYTGLVETGDIANMTSQATRGFFEAGVTTGSLDDINRTANTTSSDQHFIVTGSQGSREFNFASGTDLSSLANAINNVSDSTGVGAIVSVGQAGFTLRNRSIADIDYDSTNADGDAVINAGETIVFGQTAVGTEGITDITWYGEPILGKNTDGHGRIYVDISHSGTTYTVNLYKGAKQSDGTYREQDLVGAGTFADGGGTVTIAERNESGLSALIAITDDTSDIADDIVLATQTLDFVTTDRVSSLALGSGAINAGLTVTAAAGSAGSDANKVSVELINPDAKSQTLAVSVDGNTVTVTLGTDANGNVNSTATAVAAIINGTTTTDGGILVSAALGTGAGTMEARGRTFLSGGLDANTGINIDGDTDGFSTIAISGLELGVNTDVNGKLYLKVTDDDGDGTAEVLQIYKDEDMTTESLVAQYDTTVAGTELTDSDTIVLDEQNESGLRIAVDVGTAANVDVGNSTWTIEQGLRLYATEYGTANFVRVQALEGKLWDYYDASSDNADTDTGYVNLDSTASAVTAESRGSGGQISVNGQDVFTIGLTAEASTADFNAHLAFQEGSVGFTTIAQVGHDVAYGSTSVGQLMKASNVHMNAGVNAREDLNNFSNGMQFQLGEGAGDQERTVYGITSMSIANVGKVKFTDDFNNDGNDTTKTLSLSNLLGGGYASLAVDSIRALKVIDQAIEDVASLRARMGAFQKNTLQTNANSLQVAIENITATESDIRDADMASETTEFTRSQILVQAGTAMLAQANVQSQNVLQLLG